MSAPQWSAVDEETADLLALVATGPLAPPVADEEYDEFKRCLRYVSLADGIVDPNAMRPLLRKADIAPRRVSAFYHKASAEDLIRATGDWVLSDDKQGGNAGRPVRTYRYCGGRA